MTVALRLAASIVVLGAAGALFTACSASTELAIVNPTDHALYIQINERAPFEIASQATVKAHVPSLDRLTPISIIARDAKGATVFSLQTSIPRLEAGGKRVTIGAIGQPDDPFAQPRYALPQ